MKRRNKRRNEEEQYEWRGRKHKNSKSHTTEMKP